MENRVLLRGFVILICSLASAFSLASEISKPCSSKMKVVTIQRSLIENLGTILDGPDQIVPELTKNGDVLGFRVIEIGSDSRLDQMGLNPNDILKKFNNIKINSPGRILEMFKALRAEEVICLSVLRKEKLVLKYIKLAPKDNLEK